MGANSSGSKTIYLHIGTHKTGTTSIQAFLSENRSALLEQDVDFFSGAHLDGNHIELHICAMRKERDSPAKNMWEIFPTNDYEVSTRTRVRKFIESSVASRLVFSAEGLSYLRFSDELAYLSELFSGHQVKVVLYLREPGSFLESYTRQLLRSGFALSSEIGHFANVEPDSWLVDQDSLIEAYAASFGAENILIHNWEDVCQGDTSVIPSFLRCLGIFNSLGCLSEQMADYWLNRT